MLAHFSCFEVKHLSPRGFVTVYPSGVLYYLIDTLCMATRKAKHNPADDYPTYDELSDDEKDYLVDQRIVYVPVEDLIPYDRNAKLHDNMIAYLRNMVKRVKFRVPIHLDENRVIIAGHARRLVALELGMKRVPCIFDTDMSPEDVKLQRLADNRLTELSDYDLDMLGIEVVELKELGIAVEDFGLDFNFDDPTEGWDDLMDEEAEDDDEGGPDDFEPSEIEEGFIKEGDIVLMGEHRLICGDPMSVDVLSRVEDGQYPDIGILSIPHDDDEEADQVVGHFLLHCQEVFFDCRMREGNRLNLPFLVTREGFKDIFFWHRTDAPASIKNDVISTSVEVIVALGRNESRAFRHKSKTSYGFCEHAMDKDGGLPVAVYKDIIDEFTHEGDYVLDPFGNRGKCIIACYDTSRKAMVIEPDPRECDIIVQRYVRHTGDDKVGVVRDNKRLKYPV